MLRSGTYLIEMVLIPKTMQKVSEKRKFVYKFLAVFFVGLCLSFLALVLLVYIFFSRWADEGYSEFERIPSPDGEYEAVIFQIDMGVPTDYNRQVKIVKIGTVGRKGETLFSYRGESAPEARWLSNTELYVAPRGADYKETYGEWRYPWWGRKFTISGPTP